MNSDDSFDIKDIQLVVPGSGAIIEKDNKKQEDTDTAADCGICGGEQNSKAVPEKDIAVVQTKEPAVQDAADIAASQDVDIPLIITEPPPPPKTKNRQKKVKPKKKNELKKTHYRLSCFLLLVFVAAIAGSGAYYYSHYRDETRAFLRKVERKMYSRWLRKIMTPDTGDINEPDALGRTELHHAIFAGEPDAILDLLSKGANPLAESQDGRNCVHYAVDSDNLEILRYVVLVLGIDINKADEDGITPLHLAADNANAEMVWFLLTNGADTTLRDKSGKLPAEMSKNPKILQLFNEDHLPIQNR